MSLPPRTLGIAIGWVRVYARVACCLTVRPLVDHASQQEQSIAPTRAIADDQSPVFLPGVLKQGRSYTPSYRWQLSPGKQTFISPLISSPSPSFGNHTIIFEILVVTPFRCLNSLYHHCSGLPCLRAVKTLTTLPHRSGTWHHNFVPK